MEDLKQILLHHPKWKDPQLEASRFRQDQEVYHQNHLHHQNIQEMGNIYSLDYQMGR
jgi:hypothetical protein